MSGQHTRAPSGSHDASGLLGPEGDRNAYSRYSIASSLNRNSYADKPLGTPESQDVEVMEGYNLPYQPERTPRYHDRDSRYSTDSGGMSRESSFFGLNDQRGSQQFNTVEESLLWDAKNEEEDDYIHDPRTLAAEKNGLKWSNRGFLNIAGLVLLLGGFVALFAGWPIYVYVVRPPAGDLGAFNMGGVNGSGQVPSIENLPLRIDPDTPQEAMTRTGFDGKEYKLVFSDEFNKDGRTFWPGDDPFWEAVDIHYWQTANLEWLDPGQVTTENGKLKITMIKMDPALNHNLTYRSGMLQSWNKLCFTGGYMEASISLPGSAEHIGFWPGVWTMGNLGRAGYGGSNDGLWPYSYDSCDAGTLPNQTYPNGTTPTLAKTSGSRDYGGELSYLRGQRLSSCTCKGEDHPGPYNNGRFTGRGAPEIDAIEAEVDYHGYGNASQSMQIAPFDDAYNWNNRTSDGFEIYNSDITSLNAWKGSINQESCSGVTIIGSETYRGAAYQTVGFEVTPGGDSNSRITWAVNGTATWTLKAGAFPANTNVDVGQRLIPTEPMYMILNLGISNKFQGVLSDTQIAAIEAFLPDSLLVDYVRIYQADGTEDSLSCDPPDYPTSDYIQRNLELYMNNNLTRFPGTVPKNQLWDGC